VFFGAFLRIIVIVNFRAASLELGEIVCNVGLYPSDMKKELLLLVLE
jgi:hypothetical protein